MEKIIIEGQKQSPAVCYDKESGLFKIEGKSFAKYSRGIYLRIIEWLKEYIKNPNEETIVIFKFEFDDTSSAKLILVILKKLAGLYKLNNKVEIHWYYPDDDDDIEEAGEIYSNLIDIPITIIPYSV